MRNSYWAEVLTALHEGAANAGLELLFFTTKEDRSVEDILSRILCGLVDGVIIQPGTNNEVLDRLIESRFSVLAVGDPYRDVPAVTLENAQGTKLLMRHLYDLGHRRFVYLRVEDPECTRPFQNLAAEIRPKAYDEALAELGLDVDANPQIHINWDVKSAMDRALEAGATALVCHNDEWAYKLAMEAESRGIRIPDDLALVGFDGIPAPFARQMITTVRSPIRAMGLAAVEKLKAMVDGEPYEQVTVLPVEFVKGDTT